jgi:hypothetical protein
MRERVVVIRWFVGVKNVVKFFILIECQLKWMVFFRVEEGESILLREKKNNFYIPLSLALHLVTSFICYFLFFWT